MKLLKFSRVIVVLALALGLSACGNMSSQQKGALVGGAVGATAGALLTDNVGGAVVGGAAGALVGAAVSGKN